MNASATSTAPSPAPPPRWVVPMLGLVIACWAATVAWAAVDGVLGRVDPPLIAALVAAGIVLPSLTYFSSPTLRSLARRIGLGPLTALHMWRVPAAGAFFVYGFAGELPPLFWILAGTGDLIAGLYAAGSLRAAPTLGYFRRFHVFGFADFVVAVGTGLFYTLLLDARMAPIAQWPMALIPLFGVGLSGTAHLIAFDLLRRRLPGDGPAAEPAGGAGTAHAGPDRAGAEGQVCALARAVIMKFASEARAASRAPKTNGARRLETPP